MTEASERKQSKDLIPLIRDTIEEFDFDVSSTLQKWRTKIGNGFWRSISFAGYPYIWFGVAIIFAFLDIFHVSYVILFAELSGLITFPIKKQFQRKRPYIAHPEDIIPLKREREKDFSFPSGHTYNATVSGVSLALCYGGFISLFLMIGLAIMVGVSRVYIGVHFFSDVVGGFFLGLIIAYIISLFFPFIMILHVITLEA
ncbi:MAG: phosphatase PAP2 family protein [Promethearchaeota archaeon]